LSADADGQPIGTTGLRPTKAATAVAVGLHQTTLGHQADWELDRELVRELP